MPGIIDKTKEAVSNAADAVKDKYHDLTDSKEEHEERARESAQDAWDQTKDKAHCKKEQAKDWASEKLHKAGRKIDEH
ncbi:unnamed protein product, partial [Mesorhabditis belari]|uniref:Uncharacterized protein n=1 Tax=Mesorhabditis belari TaxID=2138241 RepID=A0AAF3F7V2_9BILA